MAYTTEQRDDLREAYHALKALFRRSEPDAWLGIRKDFGTLSRMLERANRDCAQRDYERFERITESNELLRVWRRTPRVEKRHWILDAAGEGACQMRVLAGRVAGAHPECAVYQPYIEPIVKEMVRLGDLERVPTAGRGSQPKWLYQLPAVSADVAALERALKGEVA